VAVEEDEQEEGQQEEEEEEEEEAVGSKAWIGVGKGQKSL